MPTPLRNSLSPCQRPCFQTSPPQPGRATSRQSTEPENTEDDIGAATALATDAPLDRNSLATTMKCTDTQQQSDRGDVHSDLRGGFQRGKVGRAQRLGGEVGARRERWRPPA